MLEILYVVCVIVVWVLYHKLFHVYYFNLGRGLLMELMGCAVAGAFLCILVVKFWYIVLLIVGVIVFAAVSKKR